MTTSGIVNGPKGLVIYSMSEHEKIPIQNIYYMLAYAFQILRQSNFCRIESEEFENIEDLFAEILTVAVSQQLKQGLHREYVNRIENLSGFRGKLDMSKTILNKMQRKQMLSCEFDELTENNIYNQVIKATMSLLLRKRTVKLERRCKLKKSLAFFDGIDTVKLSSIRWSSLRFCRHNHIYEMLINICYFVYASQLPTSTDGQYFMAVFSENNMAKLFEKFVLEYYRFHYGYLVPTSAQVKWDLDVQAEQRGTSFLPKMQTDIFLQNKKNGKELIIDTKFYSQIFQAHMGVEKLHSDNLYQIFAYVKNKDIGNTGNVAGMLLYADIGSTVALDYSYSIGGNPIYVRTLDLNQNFQYIAQQLNQIVEVYFGQ